MKFQIKLHKKNIPIGELIADLQKVAKEVNQDTITAATYKERGKHGVNTMLRRFGSWNEALKQASLGLNNRLNISDEELFENVMNVWQALGRQPYGREMEKSNGRSKFSLGTYEKRFGSWNKALESFMKFIESDASNEPNTKIIQKKETLKYSSKRTPKSINMHLRYKILHRDNFACKTCGASPAKNPGVELHVDHVVPYSKGGETLEENLRTLCSVCNIGRSNRFTK